MYLNACMPIDSFFTDFNRSALMLTQIGSTAGSHTCQKVEVIAVLVILVVVVAALYCYIGTKIQSKIMYYALVRSDVTKRKIQ